MDVLLLGAGRPARGIAPSALKNVSSNTTAMDWQIRSFRVVNPKAQLRYLGGYHVDDVIQRYPELKFTVVPDWESRNVVHTLLQAPLSEQPTLVTYSDTIFRPSAIEQILEGTAEVVFGVDSLWEERYQSRAQLDIDAAETLELGAFSSTQRGRVEFTGLVYLAPSVVKYVAGLTEALAGCNLIELLTHLRERGYSVQPHDVVGHWAELNSPADIAHFVLGTKAETLARLEPYVNHSHIGKQVTFSVQRWSEHNRDVLETIRRTFSGADLVVRSSNKSEDNWHASNAGGFASFLGVDGTCDASVGKAVESVIESYGARCDSSDQVLVQEHVRNVRAAGVVLTRGLETGAPYYSFNFDDLTQSTESVTSGGHGKLRTVVLLRTERQYQALEGVEPTLVPVLRAVNELEEMLDFDKLDIEFAINQDGEVNIFQVRPVTVDHSGYEVEDARFTESFHYNCDQFRARQSAGPFVVGNRTVFGNMPDWNPAEIVGTRPRPLAFSLYRHLITNEVWAKQRAEFGYRDVRPQPLIVSFSGQPYVDVRASLNSFIPASLPEGSALALANAYMGILMRNPQYHDKVEFEVALTVWTPSFEHEAMRRLMPYKIDVEELGHALKAITRNALTRLGGDISSIELLNARRELIESAAISPDSQVFELIEDCRQYGTLAFSHAARAGFVATSWLRSLVASGVLSESRRTEFMSSINTVASQFQDDKLAGAQGHLGMKDLLARYGHLRPGTYEITAVAYWEDLERYLSCSANAVPRAESHFELSSAEQAGVEGALEELGSGLSAAELFNYFRHAIEARESVKFEFTRSLSRALDRCVELGRTLGLSREDLSFLEYADIEQLRVNTMCQDSLKVVSELRRRQYVQSQMTQLPSLIVQESEFGCFERLSSEPNFVTNKKVEAPVLKWDQHQSDELNGAIVLIPQADPGYDWLFSYAIEGLITKYGGSNSHMAIRAAEMGLPAAIGVGDKLYDEISRIRRLQLDCGGKTLREVL